MATTVKTARVTGLEAIAEGARWLQLTADEPLGFSGGQFITVDTGLTQASGKPVKRAYSLVGSDREQRTFELVVKRIGEGPASSYMHRLTLGAELRFTGPWGKMVPGEDHDGPTLVLASDTGITAALGLVRSARFTPLLPAATLIWLRPSSAYFVPDAFVQGRVPAGCALRIEPAPPSEHVERVPHALALVEQHWQQSGLARAFSAGDGAINYALIDLLAARGVTLTRDRVESFFNMPKKPAPALQSAPEDRS